MAVAWRLPPQGGLEWRQWQDSAVVYHGVSGNTHQISASAYAVLSALSDGAKTTSELAQHLANGHITRHDAVSTDHCEQTCEALARLGLIEPTT
ncbi:MAG: HPr-rel-A system PqqD family peptide chaperone [Sulfuriferula sp.]